MLGLESNHISKSGPWMCFTENIFTTTTSKVWMNWLKKSKHVPSKQYMDWFNIAINTHRLFLHGCFLCVTHLHHMAINHDSIPVEWFFGLQGNIAGKYASAFCPCMNTSWPSSMPTSWSTWTLNRVAGYTYFLWNRCSDIEILCSMTCIFECCFSSYLREVSSDLNNNNLSDKS